jgi:hypothetical protein
MKNTAQIKTQATIGASDAVCRMFLVSTAHITASDNTILYDVDDRVMDMKPGWQITICDEEISDVLHYAGCSSVFGRLIELAKDCHCDFLRLDPDGPVITGLPTFKW